MGARTPSTVRLIHSKRGTDRTAPLEASPTVADLASEPTTAGPHCLSIIHYEDDENGRGMDETPLIELTGPRRRDAAELRETIKQRIRARTCERVRDLEVICDSNRVTIRGRCATFYTKQLAQHAAMGVIEDETVVNEISVGVGQ